MVIRKSDYLILGAALLALILSVWLWFTGQRAEGQFVGIWVPSILTFGVWFRLATTSEWR